MAVTRRDVLSGLVGSLLSSGIAGGSEMRELSPNGSSTGRSAVCTCPAAATRALWRDSSSALSRQTALN